MRVQYTLHNLDTGEKTEQWTNPIDIKYEPSAGERLMLGVNEAKEFGSRQFNSLNESYRSFDNKLKMIAKDVPTLEGKHGYDNGGKQLLLGTVGVVLSGGSLAAAQGVLGYTVASGGLLFSFDDMTTDQNGKTVLGELTGSQKLVNNTSLVFSAANIGKSSAKLLNGASDNTILDISNVLYDGLNSVDKIKDAAKNNSEVQPSK